MKPLFLCLSLLATALQGADSPRPNILWLIAEDFGPHLGCYGTKQVRTPNLDQLAQKGMRYNRFFTTAPVCSPSRSALITGMYQTTIGAHNHRSHRKDDFRLPPGVDLITNWLRPAGYFTANIVEFPQKLGIKGSGKTDWNFNFDGKPFDSKSWNDLKSHQPFYAQVNFQETHRVFKAPSIADPNQVDIPPYYPDHPVVREDWAKYLDAASELDRKIGIVLEQLASDGLADNTVVMFFGDNGQAHVRGKQFCYDSGLNVPLIIYWPEKIPVPKHFQPGTVSDQLLAAIDLTATTLALAHVKRPERMQGEVFLGDEAAAPREYVFGARDRCDETIFRFRTVRDARYRYIINFTPDRPFLLENAYKQKQYPVWNLLKELDQARKLTTASQLFLVAPTMPKEELYDLMNDPHETVNLAESQLPEYRDARARLREALLLWIESSQDHGAQDDTTQKIFAE